MYKALVGEQLKGNLIHMFFVVLINDVEAKCLLGGSSPSHPCTVKLPTYTGCSDPRGMKSARPMMMGSMPMKINIILQIRSWKTKTHKNFKTVKYLKSLHLSSNLLDKGPMVAKQNPANTAFAAV